MQITIDNTYFRDFSTEYKQYVCCIKATHKQASPFICVSPDGYIQGITHLNILLSMSDDTIVIHAWSGNYRTDVFSYRLGDVRKDFQNG